jgi:hypothetical protein
LAPWWGRIANFICEDLRIGSRKEQRIIHRFLPRSLRDSRSGSERSRSRYGGGLPSKRSFGEQLICYSLVPFFGGGNHGSSGFSFRTPHGDQGES